MVYKMKRYIQVIILLIMTFAFSCEKPGIVINCSECTQTEPSKATIRVKLEGNYDNSSVQIKIYEGNLEDNILYWTYTTSASNASFQVNMNKKYTVTAEYNIPEGRYIAVDSATPRVRFEEDQCENPCYFVYDNNFDLRLKYR